MTDEEIIGLYIARDETAIRETQRSYDTYCRALAGRILGNSRDVEEIVSDTWLKAWQSIPPANPRDLKLYLAKICRNLSCNRLRDQSAAKRGSEATVLLDELAECLPGGGSAEDALAAKELRKAVNQFLHTLPRRDADLFLRRYFFAEEMADIARRYGLRTNTVSVSLHRTRAKLRDYLTKEGYL